jgi:hypothetical protein
MPKRAESDKPGGKPFRKEKASMDTIFESLQQTTHRLNSTADAANELIRSANERLAEIGAGVPYASNICELSRESHSKYDEAADIEVDAGFDVEVLSYGKIYGKWQLGIELRHFVPGEGGPAEGYDFVGADDLPLLNADREIRIRAAAKLPAFLQEYRDYLEDLADELN